MNGWGRMTTRQSEKNHPLLFLPLLTYLHSRALPHLPKFTLFPMNPALGHF
jgi:hypothetical protein